MPLRDLGAIFNRTFIIGFFVPSAIGTMAISGGLYSWLNQSYLQELDTQDIVLFATLVSLGTALLVQGLWNPIVVYLFQGYIHEARGGARYYITWPAYRLLLIR